VSRRLTVGWPLSGRRLVYLLAVGWLIGWSSARPPAGRQAISKPSAGHKLFLAGRPLAAVGWLLLAVRCQTDKLIASWASMHRLF
jgi:hypothetical protein